MSGRILADLAVTFATLSLFCVGGANAALPEVHRLVVEQWRWMDDSAFATLTAIGQTAPGPNVMVISMVGWKMAGVLGMLVATAALVTPSAALALVLGRAMVRYEERAWLTPLRRSLAPVAVGLMLASALVMTEAAHRGSVTLLLTLAMILMVAFTRATPLWGLAACAGIGILAGRLHLMS